MQQGVVQSQLQLLLAALLQIQFLDLDVGYLFNVEVEQVLPVQKKPRLAELLVQVFELVSEQLFKVDQTRAQGVPHEIVQPVESLFPFKVVSLNAVLGQADFAHCHEL